MKASGGAAETSGGAPGRSAAAPRRRLPAGGLAAVGAGLLAVTWTHGALLTAFAFLFRVEDPPARSDALVVLQGSAADRSARAAELYRRGLAPVVLLGRTRATPFDETGNNRALLVAYGVPPEAIRVLPGGVVESTYDEALRVRGYVRTHPVRAVIVVTTAYHTARARWAFRRALRGSGVAVRLAASEDPGATEAGWYTGGYGVKKYLWEALANPYYRLAY